jgi:hypothetical protein
MAPDLAVDALPTTHALEWCWSSISTRLHAGPRLLEAATQRVGDLLDADPGSLQPDAWRRPRSRRRESALVGRARKEMHRQRRDAPAQLRRAVSELLAQVILLCVDGFKGGPNAGRS